MNTPAPQTRTQYIAAVAIVGTLVTGCFAGIWLVKGSRDFEGSIHDCFVATELSAELEWIDCVLDSTVRLALHTGDRHWYAKHRSLVKANDARLAKLQMLSQELLATPLGNNALQANAAVVRIQTRALRAAAAGDGDAAAELLSSDDYATCKSIYRTSLNRVVKQVQINGMIWDRREHANALFLMACLLMTAASIVWMLMRAQRSTETNARKQAAALRVERTRLAMLIRHTPAAVAMFDDELRCIAMSQRWLDQHGLGPDWNDAPDATSAPRDLGSLAEFLPPRLTETLRESGGRSVQACDDESWCRPDSVELRSIQWEVRPWQSAEGRHGGVIVFTHDITDERQIQDSLRRHKATTTHMSRLAQVGWWELNPDNGTVTWSEQTRRIHAVDDAFVPTLKSCLQFYAEAYRQPIANQIEAALETQTAFQFEAPITDNDGKDRWVRVVGEAIVDDGRVTQLVGAVQDFTSQRNAAKRLDQAKQLAERNAAKIQSQHRLVTEVIESIPGAVYWKNQDLEFIGCNQIFAESVGCESPAELAGRSQEAVHWDFTPEDRESLISDAEILRSGRKVINAEACQVLADGTKLILLVSKVPLVDADGRVFGVLAMMQDVTESRKLERELAHARKLESIGQLSAGIAHEINTPMQCVGMNLEFVQEHSETLFARLDEFLADLTPDQFQWDASVAAGDDSLRQYEMVKTEIPSAIAEACDASSRIIEIVAAMKTLSHPGTESKVPTDVNQLIRDAATVSRHCWKQIAEIEFDLDDDLPEINVLPAELSQVWLNLIVNAADAIAQAQARAKDVVARQGTDHSDPAGQARLPKFGKITLRSRVHNDGVAFACLDDGVGMPDHVANRIFDPFFTTKQVGKGTGQGLTLAYDMVVNRHHGKFDVRSRESDSPAGPRGTEMRFWLPKSGTDPQSRLATDRTETLVAEPLNSNL